MSKTKQVKPRSSDICDALQGFVGVLRRGDAITHFAAFEGGLTGDYLKAQVYDTYEDAHNGVSRRKSQMKRPSLYDVPEVCGIDACGQLVGRNETQELLRGAHP